LSEVPLYSSAVLCPQNHVGGAGLGRVSALILGLDIRKVWPTSSSEGFQSLLFSSGEGHHSLVLTNEVAAHASASFTQSVACIIGTSVWVIRSQELAE